MFKQQEKRLTNYINGLFIAFNTEIRLYIQPTINPGFPLNNLVFPSYNSGFPLSVKIRKGFHQIDRGPHKII